MFITWSHNKIQFELLDYTPTTAQNGKMMENLIEGYAYLCIIKVCVQKRERSFIADHVINWQKQQSTIKTSAIF